MCQKEKSKNPGITEPKSFFCEIQKNLRSLKNCNLYLGQFAFQFNDIFNNDRLQYCDSNIGLFSIAPHLVNAPRTLRQQKLSLLISLLLSFVDWFMTSFLYCFPYSYRSSNFCDSNSCRSFTLLKTLAKSKKDAKRIKSGNFTQEQQRKVQYCYK